MKPCPKCRGKTSIEDLEHELAVLEWRRDSRPVSSSINNVFIGNAASAGTHSHGIAMGYGTLSIGHGDGEPERPVERLPESGTTCANCGFHWVQSARDRAEALIAKIRAVKIELSPVEALGDLVRPELSPR